VAAVGAVVVAVAVGTIVVWQQGQTQAATSYIGSDGVEASAISSSVSGKLGTYVTCDHLGFGTAGSTYRCNGGTVDECWVLIDSSNISGSGVRLARRTEVTKFGTDCRSSD